MLYLARLGFQVEKKNVDHIENSLVNFTPIFIKSTFQATVFDLLTALCAQVFQNYWEHSVVVKYVSTH